MEKENYGYSDLEFYKMEKEFKKYKFCLASKMLKKKFIEVIENEEKEK